MPSLFLSAHVWHLGRPNLSHTNSFEIFIPTSTLFYCLFRIFATLCNFKNTFKRFETFKPLVKSMITYFILNRFENSLYLDPKPSYLGVEIKT